MKERNNILDGILGLAIGDALGVPVEFKTREYLQRNPVTDMRSNGTYLVPKGTWSDDTSMTLATMDSIIHTNSIDTNDMGDKFISWFREARYTATGQCFDIGRTTLQALAKYELKQDDAKNCGNNGVMDNGNGSLMRILPIAYYIWYNKIEEEKEIIDIVKEVSSITHAHEISIIGCYLYVRYAIEIIKGNSKEKAYAKIKQLDLSYFHQENVAKYDRIVKSDIQKCSEDEIKTSGYVVDTLEATLWLFLNSEDYNNTILKAVNLGEDTDTVAACTGGLLGIYYGIDNIKDSWKKELQNINQIEELSMRLEQKLKEKMKS